MDSPVHPEQTSVEWRRGAALPHARFGRVRVWFDDSALALVGSVTIALAVFGLIYVVARRIVRPPVPTPRVSLQLVADEVRGLQDGAAGTEQDPNPAQANPSQRERPERESADTAADVERPETPLFAARPPKPEPESGNLAGALRAASAELERAKNRRSAAQAPLAATGTGRGRAGRTGTMGDQPSARFFGLGADGAKSVIYVIDCSGSMRGGKLELAKAELLRSIRGLTAEQSFRVIFFKAMPIPMPGDGLLPATLSNKIRAEEWLETIEASGGTDPIQAALLALRERPEVVYVLSDGQFNAQACNVIRDGNRGPPRATIYTIGFGDSSGEAQLTRLARESGGQYRFVPLHMGPLLPRGRRR